MQIQRSVDDPDMTERLREIAQHAPGSRIVLLSQKPDVIAQSAQAIKQVTGLLIAALEDIHIGEPERTDQKRSLTA
jgi:hypothetical protein